MSSKVNEALFELIQSMTKSEKRYFKLLSSRHTIGNENNYILLFNAIEKQTEYSEEQLFSMFKGQAFLNRFSITKKRLYDHILSSLDAFHAANSIDAQLFKMLHSADILHNKSLYDQSKRILRSAEKLAEKHDRKEILLLVSGKQKKLLETTGYLQLTEKIIDEVAINDRKIQKRIDKYNSLWAIKGQLFVRLTQKGVARSKEERMVFEGICAEALSNENNNLESFEAKYLLYHIRSAYFYAIGNLKDSLKNLEYNLELFDKEQEIDANKQLSVYTNAIYICDKLGEHKKSIYHLGSLKKMENSVDSNEDLSIKLFSSITSIELNLFLRKGAFDKAFQISKTIEEKLTKFDDKIIPIRRAFLAFKMAVIHIGMNDFNRALFWINSILNDSKLDKTEDIIGYTQLLDLLVHVELNNHELLPYTLKSTTRFFKKRDKLHGFEKIFLQFIHRITKCKDHFEIADLWQEFYNDLDSMNDTSFENIALEYFDFKSWAEAKLKNTSFSAIVSDKYNAKLRNAS